MALTDTQIAQRLLKKGLGVAETNYPLANRGVLEEAIPTYSVVTPESIWTEASGIPSTPPILPNEGEDGVVKYYEKLQLVITDAGTAVAFKSPAGELENAISGKFGFGYNFKVYGNGGATQVYKGDWLVDAESGVLIFYNPGLAETTIDASHVPYITFYKYIGQTGFTGMSTELSTEISSRISGDTSLSNELSTEISSRISDDTSLSTAISSEGSIRNTADTSLSTSLSFEIFVRLSTDIILDGNISAESSTRISEVQSLSTSIDTKLSLSGGTMQGAIDMNGYQITINTLPTNDYHLTNKEYVDALVQGVSIHEPVRVVATGNTILSGETIIDGYSILEGEFVLLAGQTDKTENGLWVVHSGGTGWTRRPDADGDPNNEIELGDFVFILSGTTNNNTGWALGKTDAPTGQTYIIPGVDTQEWFKMAAPGTYTTDGEGLELSGATKFYLELDGSTLTKSASGIKLNDSLSTAISQNTNSISSEVSTRTSDVVSLSSAILEPWIDINRNGFVDNSETSLSFNPGTYVFTLSGLTSSWSYYRAGLKHTIVGNKTITLPGTPPTAGIYFISINSTDGTLIQSMTPWTLQDSTLPVALILWNNDNTPQYHFAEERHTVLIDRRIHLYLHSTRGTQFVNGGNLTGPNILDASNSGTTFGVSDTTIADEDLFQTLTGLTRPNGSTLTYNVFYRLSTSGWTWQQSDQPFKYNGVNYIEYDNNAVMTSGSSGNYYNTYMLFTDLNSLARYSIVMGRNEYTSLANAQSENPLEFSWTGFPIAESVIAYQFTWFADSGNTNKGLVSLAAAPVKINVATTSTVSSGGGVDHNTLAGLQGGTTNEFYHLTYMDYVVATGVSTTLSSEISTRVSDVLSLSTAISTNVPTGITSLSTALSNEISNTNSDVLSLSTAISTNVPTGITSLSTALSSEISTTDSDVLSLSAAISSMSGETENITDNLLQGDLLYFTGTTISGTTNQFPALSTSISSEILIRTSADLSLSTAISSATPTGITSLSTALSNEISSTNSDVLSLSTAISTNVPTGITSLSTALSNEISYTNSDVLSLSAAISNVSGDTLELDSILDNYQLLTMISGELTGVTYSFVISGESSVRVSSDASLSTEISSEISRSTSISTNLSTEISTRTSVDTSLITQVSSEISRSTSLSTNLSSEISTRGSADTSLSTQISSEISTRTSNVLSLSSAVYSEISTRTAEDATFLKLSGGTMIGGITGTTINLSNEIISANTRKITLFDITSGSTSYWNMNSGCSARLVITGATTLNISNVVSGDNGTLIITQWSTGIFTFPANSKYAGGTPHTLSGGGQVDILSFYYDGTNYYWNIGKNYA